MRRAQREGAVIPFALPGLLKRIRLVGRGALSLAIATVIAVGLAPNASAQAQAPAPSASPPPTAVSSSSGGGPRKQLATIIYAGLGGAILGLSTLSFYGRPQEKLSNIAIGFALGVIAGTTFVTYKAASNPSEFYGLRPLVEQEAERARLASRSLEPQASWSWTF